mmetsp:Transcript_12480/g.23774  ORF Transcript_12480/g.23774 Transcript_12480/m.23774 type:complete len:87 (+) Transcript_12480:226-486(+)
MYLNDSTSTYHTRDVFLHSSESHHRCHSPDKNKHDDVRSLSISLHADCLLASFFIISFTYFLNIPSNLARGSYSGFTASSGTPLTA